MGGIKKYIQCCPICLCTDCKHDYRKIEIDSKIYPIIKTLNDKGYRTSFCCEGHFEKSIFQLYILFSKQYDFSKYKHILKDFEVNNWIYRTNIEFIKYKQYKLERSFNKKQARLLEQLYEFVEALPIIKN